MQFMYSNKNPPKHSTFGIIVFLFSVYATTVPQDEKPSASNGDKIQMVFSYPSHVFMPYQMIWLYCLIPGATGNS